MCFQQQELLFFGCLASGLEMGPLVFVGVPFGRNIPLSPFTRGSFSLTVPTGQPCGYDGKGGHDDAAYNIPLGGGLYYGSGS